MRAEGLPFPVGTTYFNGATPNTGSESTAYEGRCYYINRDNFTSGGVRTSEGPGHVTLMVVRNSSTSYALPKIGYLFTAGYLGRRINAVASAATHTGHIVDPYLPAVGCTTNDLCYVVVRGIVTGTSAASSPAIVDQEAVEFTTGGKLKVIADIATSGAIDLNAAIVCPGIANEAQTSTNSDVDIWVHSKYSL